MRLIDIVYSIYALIFVICNFSFGYDNINYYSNGEFSYIESILNIIWQLFNISSLLFVLYFIYLIYYKLYINSNILFSIILITLSPIIIQLFMLVLSIILLFIYYKMNHSRNEIQKIAKIKIIKPKIKNYPIHTDQSKELLYALNEFQIYGEITNVSHGPLITLYEFLPKSGTRSARIISLTDDIGRNIQNSNIRIQTITGNNSIGIEISNQEKDIVLFHDLYKKIDYSNYTLPIILGKDITGDTFCADLSLMPHLLIAGTTGSGKSVGINSMIMSLLLSRSKDECQFVLIDPKRLEFIQYEKIKNLFMPVMYDTDKIINALELLIKEMNSRYDQMAKAKVRNISQYRKKLPYIIVVIDEFADLIAILGKKIEILIQRLAQMARAAGIHLILSTQRPSVDIITGTIKANFPSRIAYKLASKIDSRTIIHDQGAEQLLGNGDLLYLPNTGATIRLHAPYISTDDIKKLLRKI